MRLWLLGMALIAGGPAVAEPARPALSSAASAPIPLTLERVFADPDLSGPQPQFLRFSPDGTLITSLRNRADDKRRFDLWARDVATGQERMLVDSKKVGSGGELSEAEKMQRERDRSLTGKIGIVQYDWSPDGRTILVPLDGDLYLADRAGGVRRLTQTPGGELNAKVSPRGSYVSFVRDQNLFVQPIAGGAARAVTQGGGGTVHWGEAEFVAQEEMDRRTGYWWSPDEAFVAVERFDEAPVNIATRAAIGTTGTRTYEQRYPAAGMPNALVEVYVMKPDGSARVKVDLGADSDIYLARVTWAPDGKTLLVQRETRDQRRLDMLSVDPATGKTTTLFQEKADTKSWINLTDAYRVLADGSIIWRSERDGFGHLWRWRAGKWAQLTKGDWVVDALVSVDQARGRLYFLGNRDGPLEQHLYALDLAKPMKITRLTEAGWWNNAVGDAAGARFVITRSSPDQPPQTYLADDRGTRLAWLNENSVAGDHPYAPYLASHRTPTYGTIKAADGSDLYWEMIAPPLEPGKRYPVFFQHYGGPNSQEVKRDWRGPLAQYLVDRGWIFFQIDNRGSYNRGKAFEDEIYRAMGSVEVTDQLAGARYLQTLPFVDGDRIATYGWSYGGYMTVKMLEANPGVYAAGVAGAPVTDWSLYDTHYTERYMGTPTADAAAYARSGAIADAGKIADPLLIVHGMADDNVFLDNTTRLAAELQGKAAPFEMMLYPGQTHRVGGPGISEHLWRTIMSFLDRAVKDKPVAPARPTG